MATEIIISIIINIGDNSNDTNSSCQISDNNDLCETENNVDWKYENNDNEEHDNHATEMTRCDVEGCVIINSFTNKRYCDKIVYLN